jgi:multisubunit Na+/H+ antiporter MnhB subunit
MHKNYNLEIGRVAAIFIVIETIVFAFSLIWGVIFHTEFDQNLGFIASLLLAVSVVIMMACFYESTPDRLKILGLLALVSSILYAPFCIGNYFLQLSIVALNPLNLSSEVLKAIDFIPGSPTFAMDMLGYGFLCLSTLAAGFALTETKDKILRGLCFFHGAIAVPTFTAPIISGLFRSTSGQTNDIGSYILLF